MWASPGASYFGPLTASASDRGLTVDITAKVDRIVWDMGNGDKVTCTGPGTPYERDGPARRPALPDCGYDNGYPKAGTYRVSATTSGTCTGAGGGESGDIAQTRTSGIVQIQINELQVVTRVSRARAPATDADWPGRWTRRSPRRRWSGSAGSAPGCSAWPCC